MIKNYFKTAWRSIRKNKLYAAINIVGLSAGLAACLLIAVYIYHELSYDKFNVNAKRIVRATMEYRTAGTVNTTATTGTKVGPQFERVFPPVQEYVRTFISSSVVKAGDKIFDESRMLFADQPFFKIFSFHIVEGDAATALDAPDKMVITRSMARKYFGNETAVNKTIRAIGKDFIVSAICEDIPQNSQLKFDFATQFMNLSNVKEETWWNANWVTYFLLQDDKSIGQLQRDIDGYMKTPELREQTKLSGDDYLAYHLEPLTRVHLHSSLPGFEPNGDIGHIYMFLAVALLILIIACANYTNLATAQSAGRSSEVGMRKVMGASKRQVFTQFMGESSLIAAMAAILAFLLASFLIPYFNTITGKQFGTDELLQPRYIIGLALFTLLVGFFAGLYPALILSGTRIMSVLKSGFNFTGGKHLLRKTLIVAQFGISVFLIIYTGIILQQMRYTQTKNLGYDKEHIVVLPIGGKMLNDFQSIKETLLKVPGVKSITASYETPEYVKWGDGITAIDEKGKYEVSLNAMPVDFDFISTMKMQLQAGRDFQQSDLAIMDTTNKSANFHQPYIINEALARKIGWTPEQAIGKIIEKNATGPVVGVVKDFNFSSLHEPVSPLLLFLGREYSRVFMVRISGDDMKGTLGRLGMTWKQLIPERPFNYHFLDDDYNKLYIGEQRESALFSVAAGLAIILACLGLFGLAAFTTMQRTKEIGIRRILGANISTITILIAKNFLQLVGLAIFIAVPLAWWAGNHWLQDFAYRVHIGWWVFAGAGIMALLIAFLTVSLQAVKAAIANPVKSLRTE